MSLSLRMALGRKERVTEVQGGMSPKWLERVGLYVSLCASQMMRKHDFVSKT